MRWFKHMAASANDEKLSRLMDAAGLEGYGFWWRVVEAVAGNMGADDRTSAAFSAKKWGNSLGISPKKFRTLAGLCADFGLFSVEHSENLIRIDIPNILKFRDEYTDRKFRKAEGRREALRPSRARLSETETEAETERSATPSPSPAKGRGVGASALSSRESSALRDSDAMSGPAEADGPAATERRAPGAFPERADGTPGTVPRPRLFRDGGDVPGDKPAREAASRDDASGADAFSRPDGADGPADSSLSGAGADLGFQQFLAAYPAARREPVGEAAQVWKKLAREKALPGLPRLLQGLDAWEDSGQWRKDNGAYIPKAANFLRRSMWISAPPDAPGETWDAAAAMERLRAAARGARPVEARP